MLLHTADLLQKKFYDLYDIYGRIGDSFNVPVNHKEIDYNWFMFIFRQSCSRIALKWTSNAGAPTRPVYADVRWGEDVFQTVLVMPPSAPGLG